MEHTQIIDATSLAEQQLAQHATLSQELLEAAQAITVTVDTIDQCELVKKDIQWHISLIETMRKRTKEPFLEAWRTIDDIAKRISAPAEEAKAIMNKKLLEYSQEQERLRREKEQKRQMLVQRIGSMTAEDFLQNFGGDIVIDDPIIAQAVTARRQKIKLEEEKCKLEEELEKQRQQNADNEEAIKKAQKEKEALERQQAIADAEAKQKLEKIEKKDAKADASTLAKNIRTVTSFVVTDASLVPRAYLIPDEKAIKSAIASGITDIPGVTITTEQVVR